MSTTDLSSLLSPDALPLGLGCSRLGSVGGASRDEARTLVRRALDEGVRFFDTSNIYGQGDSERLLGEVLAGRDDCVVESKAGKYLVWHRKILVPLKGVLRASARRSAGARGTVTAARARVMPARWDAAHLTASLDGSLRRLRAERVQVFMLHSPPVTVLRQGDAVGALERARQAGKVGVVGVSVDDAGAAAACLDDDRVRALQIPFGPDRHDFDDVIGVANERGVAVIAREIFGGVGGPMAHADPAAFTRHRTRAVVGDPRIAMPLVGTTSVSNLMTAIDAARSRPVDGS